MIRYADPTAYLITPEAWSAQRAEFCALVGVPAFPAEALAGVDTELLTALGELEQVLAGGQGPVRVDEHGELGHRADTPLRTLPEEESTLALSHSHVYSRAGGPFEMRLQA